MIIYHYDEVGWFFCSKKYNKLVELFGEPGFNWVYKYASLDTIEIGFKYETDELVARLVL